jgi:hypothetical protein
MFGATSSAILKQRTQRKECENAALVAAPRRTQPFNVSIAFIDRSIL